MVTITNIYNNQNKFKQNLSASRFLLSICFKLQFFKIFCFSTVEIFKNLSNSFTATFLKPEKIVFSSLSQISSIILTNTVSFFLSWKVKKNYPVGFSMLSSSMAMAYSEMFRIKIIALGIQKLQLFLKHKTEINHF